MSHCQIRTPEERGESVFELKSYADPLACMHMHPLLHWCSPKFLHAHAILGVCTTIGSPGGWGYQLPASVDAQRSGSGRTFEVEGKLRVH